jgi:hypothetical protein
MPSYASFSFMSDHCQIGLGINIEFKNLFKAVSNEERGGMEWGGGGQIVFVLRTILAFAILLIC